MQYPSLVTMFLGTAARYPDRTALAARAGGEYQTATYAATAESVRRLGASLVRLGVRPGDRVALFSENRPEWALADLAAYTAGAIIVPLYATLPGPQAEYILADSGASMLVVAGEKQTAIAQALQPRLPGIRHIIAAGAPAPEGMHAFDALAAEEPAAEETAECDRRVAALTRDDIATIVYTSGTTGDPKGALLSHGNILANLEGAARVLNIMPDDIFLSFLPLSHIFERMAGYYLALRNGAAIYYAESIFTVARDLETVRPTLLMSVPRLYENMQQRILDAAAKAPPKQRRLIDWALRTGHERSRCRLEHRPLPPALRAQHALADRLVLRKVRARTGGRLRVCVSGGAPLPPETAEFLFSLGICVIQGYGLTETSPVIAVNLPEDPRPDTVGPPMHNVEVKIAADGEICTRGPAVFHGYWKKPEETAASLDNDGWFHTGDIGEMTADGHVRITDRKKNLLVLSNGKKVAPQPIETALKSSPLIADVVLLGDRRTAVGALIVPDFDAVRARDGLADLDNETLATHPEVRRFVREEIDRLTGHLAEFERIKRFALLPREFRIDSGEITPTLKPRRQVILEHFAPQVRSVYPGEEA